MNDDDMILPNDYVETPSEVEPADTQEDTGFDDDSLQADSEVTTPTEQPETNPEPVTEPQRLKVKYNGQEMDLAFEEAVTLAQKGLNYEKAIERARQESAQQAKDAVIAEMGMQWNGQPITTEAQYRQAMQEQRLIEQYKSHDLPPEVIQELVESRRDREERQRERAAKEAESKQVEDWNQFFQYFQDMNGRQYDPQKDVLPADVVNAVNNGQTLKYAYMEHFNKELRNQLAISKQNAANIKKAPIGSVTAGGGTKTESEDDFLAGFNSI